MKASVSIVLPVYNQGSFIGKTAREAHDALLAVCADFEMILVANGCVDNSVEVCEALARELPRVRVIVPPGRGWGHAVRVGLSAAKGEILCYTNSARTSADELSRLVGCALANPGNVVKATRKLREGLVRRFGSLLYNALCRFLFDLPYWDLNGTPKIFPREFSKLLSLTCDDDLIDLEFLIVCRESGYLMLEVPTFKTDRHGGVSTTNFRCAMRLYRGAFRMWWQRRRIRAER